MILNRLEPQIIPIYEGEDMQIEVPIVDARGDGVSTSGFGATFRVYYPRRIGRASDTVLFEKTSAAGGITVEASSLTIILVPADTDTREGAWPYFLAVTNGDGEEQVVLNGMLSVAPRPQSIG